MNKIEIDKDEILKSSKWVRFIFMVLYAFAINFALTICIGLAFPGVGAVEPHPESQMLDEIGREWAV